MTPRAAALTTRKLAATAAALALLVLGGCATPGPLHLYSLATATADHIADAGAERAQDTPSFLREDDTVIGFAYDPFTDHFFLRLAPGDAIRVVDRPARAIKREFKLAELKTAGLGELAIRPRDGHVFAALPSGATLGEFTRYGEFVRTIAVERLARPIRGVAFDMERYHLLLVAEGATREVSVHAPDGRFVSVLTLDRAIAPAGLAYDSDKRELYAPLADTREIGVFGADGKLARTLPTAVPFFDVGPRSFIRMF
jgi:hypothetical protein